MSDEKGFPIGPMIAITGYTVVIALFVSMFIIVGKIC